MAEVLVDEKVAKKVKMMDLNSVGSMVLTSDGKMADKSGRLKVYLMVN
jgi:hypothetical protein